MVESIETKRLLLSAPKLSEVPALFEFLGDPVAMQYTQCDASIAKCRCRIAAHEWQRRKDGYAPWTIREKKESKIIGWGGLCDDPFDPGWGIELAYYFTPSVWGNGYGSELCEVALEIADKHLKMANVTAFAHPDNTASRTLLIKMGFRHQRFITGMNRNLYSRDRWG